MTGESAFIRAPSFDMRHRAGAAFIVVFWLVMISLLLRLEISPDQSGILTVPASHVFNLMFAHQQTSELFITDSRREHIGNLTLRPKTDPRLDERSLGFGGGFLFKMPNTRCRRINWNGSLTMDRAFKTLHWEFDFDFREPDTHVHASLNPGDHQIHYKIKQGGQIIEQSSFPADDPGVNSFLRDKLLFDPGVVENFRSNLNPPTLTAKQTELKYRKEKIAAYLLTVRQGEIVLAEIYVSQLGQILTAQTIFGCTFSAEDMMP